MANSNTETEIINPFITSRSYVVIETTSSSITHYYYCGSCKKTHSVAGILSKDAELYETHCPLCGAEHDLHTEATFELYAKSKTVFEDTGNINYHVYYRTVKFNHSKLHFYPDSQALTVILKKASGKAFVKFNSNSARSSYDIENIVNKVAKYFPHELPFRDYASFRKYNNPRLVDLQKFIPDRRDFTHNFYSVLSINERRRIFYAIDKHGSKGAFKAIAPTINSKVIRSFLWRLDMEVYHNPAVRLLKKGFTIHQVEGLIKAHKTTGEVNHRLYRFLHTYLVLGMSTRKAINFDEKFGMDQEKQHYLADSARMVQALGRDYVLPVHYSHPNLHNIVLRDYLAVTEKERESIEFKTPEVAFDWTYTGYVIKRVTNSKELRFVGSIMQHCVGTYDNAVMQGLCQIYTIYKEGDLENPLVCIEVKQDHAINQAKLARNKAVSTDPVLRSVVQKWMNEFGVLKPNTLDLVTLTSLV